jgi:Fur family transcriptional regulator, ferric uptake regulator
MPAPAPTPTPIQPAKRQVESVDGAGASELEIIEPLCAVFRRKLKAEGLKYTPERAQVLDTVMGFDGLFEADRVLETVRRSGLRVSKATVYRTIKLLQEAGIIQRALFDEEQTHYQVVYGKSVRDTIVRVDTGETISVEVPELERLRDAVCRVHGLEAKGHRLTIFAVPRQE